MGCSLVGGETGFIFWWPPSTPDHKLVNAWLMDRSRSFVVCRWPIHFTCTSEYTNKENNNNKSMAWQDDVKRCRAWTDTIMEIAGSVEWKEKGEEIVISLTVNSGRDEHDADLINCHLQLTPLWSTACHERRRRYRWTIEGRQGTVYMQMRSIKKSVTIFISHSYNCGCPGNYVDLMILFRSIPSSTPSQYTPASLFRMDVAVHCSILNLTRISVAY